MMLDLTVIHEMTTHSVQLQDERRGSPETFIDELPVRGAEETLFLVNRYRVPSTRRTGTLTATGEELRSRSDVDAGAQVAPRLRPDEPADPADLARDARVALLARNCEGTSTVEDDARFEILTQRLRKLRPRVEREDIGAISDMVDQLETVSDNLDEIRSKFGF